MRQALATTRRRGQQTAQVRTIQVPKLGWNARDAISAMSKDYAFEFENIMRVPRGARTRPGYAVWATGLGEPIESLMEYAPSSGLPKLFAATEEDIFDVTAAGAVGASVQTGLANGRWEHVNFGTTGGNYLIAVNGVDAPRHYNGTTWASPVITGASANLFAAVTVHMNRLWFAEAASLKVWYLDVQAIAGDASLLDLRTVCKKGGYILALASWTRDGGAGLDDCFVAITNKGEVAVYTGSDPSSATDFRLQGVFSIAEPIGRRCVYTLGSELLVLTSQGLIPLSQTVGLSVASQTNKSVTDAISGAFAEAYENNGGSFGWQVLEWPKANLLIVNVPIAERGIQEQFVFGTATGAWAKFSNINAGCFSLLGSDLFFGGNAGTVYRVGGFADAGVPIISTYRHAYLDMGTPSVKVVGLARPRMIAPPEYRPVVAVSTDFDETPITAATIAALSSGSEWDVDYWDEAMWGADAVASQEWQSVEGVGSTISVGFRLASTVGVTLNGMDLSYQVGGPL